MTTKTKSWKDIQVGDVLKDGSIVTQVHRTHLTDSCRVIYDNDREMICSYNHIFLIDIHELSMAAKNELDSYCTFVPLEESLSITSDIELTLEEKLIVEQFCRNESINIPVDTIIDNEEVEVYKFHFPDRTITVQVKNIIIRKEPQKVDNNTYWLTCRGIEYLMNKYNSKLYCNDLVINKIESVGKLPCFCISTNTGKYET